MLRFCAWKQISYNLEHPKLYIDTKETMSRGGCYENVFLGTFHKMARGLLLSPVQRDVRPLQESWRLSLALLTCKSVTSNHKRNKLSF